MNFCYIYTQQTPLQNIFDNVSNGTHKSYLLSSLSTLLHYYKDNINKLYILIDNNINDDEYNNLENDIHDVLINENCNFDKLIIKLIDLSITQIIKYPENNINYYKINRIGLLKFFIPYLVDCDSLFYVDCDILFHQNISDKLYENYNDNTLMKMWMDGHNSGFILFNCKKYRENKFILKDIIEYYNTTQNIQYVDNQCFDWIVNDKYKDQCITCYDKSINCDEEHEKFIEDPDFYKHHYVIHATGNFEFKNMLFDTVYSLITNEWK